MARKNVIAFLCFILFFSVTSCAKTAQISVTQQAQTQSAQSQVAQTRTTQARNFPLYTDSQAGFSVEKPYGWKVTVTNGEIWITKDPQQTIGVMIIPVRLKQDFQSSYLFSLFANALGGVIKKGGGSFALYKQYETGQGTIHGAVAAAEVQGVSYFAPMWVEKAPGFMTWKMYFAPRQRLSAEEETLREIANSFSRQTVIPANYRPGTNPYRSNANYQTNSWNNPPARPSYNDAQVSLQPYRSAYYIAGVPQGWQITGETQSGIDLASGDHTAAVSFAYMSGAGGAPQNFIMQMLPNIFSGVQVVKSYPMPSPAQGWQAGAVEFEGTLNSMGRRFHAMAVAQTMNGYTTSYAMFYLLAATPDRWAYLHPLLMRVAESIQITSGNVGERIGEQNQMFNALENTITSNENAINNDIMQGWSERSHIYDTISEKRENAILGQEEAVDPDGNKYTVPYDYWWDKGPDGPGYYKQEAGGWLQKLTVVQPH